MPAFRFPWWCLQRLLRSFLKISCWFLMDSFGKDISWDVLRICVLNMSLSFSLYTCSVGSLLCCPWVAYICFVVFLLIAWTCPWSSHRVCHVTLMHPCWVHVYFIRIVYWFHVEVLWVSFSLPLSMLWLSYVFPMCFPMESVYIPYAIPMALPGILCQLFLAFHGALWPMFIPLV